MFKRILQKIYEGIDIDEYNIIFEPGRFIVGDAFIGLTKVIDIRSKTHKKWVIIDLGANFLIPLKRAEYDFIPLEEYNGEKEKFYIGDYSISSIGVLSNKPVLLPRHIRIGDFLMVLNIGAYTFPFANNFLSTRPLVLSYSEHDTPPIRVVKKRDNIKSVSDRILSEEW